MPRHEQEEAAPLSADSSVDEPDPGPGAARGRSEAETQEDLSRHETRPTQSARTRPLPAGVGRYQVRGELGRGGVGVVYLAWDPHLEREVALKTLIAGRDASEVQIERFLREVRAATRLRHPHLVSVHDAGVEDGCFYLAMDRIEGESLADLLERERSLAPRRAAELLLPIAKALAHAHGEGFLHRDVKPENLLIDTAGECYLTDFGLAVDLSEGERLTHTHQSLGTPAFMAPEQLRGQNRDRRVDVYSLGATLYECLTGRVPYDADSFPELLHQVLTTEPPRPRELRPRLAPDLEAIVLTCLEREPEQRYPGAAELAADLERFLAGEAVQARGPSRLRRLRRRLVHYRALVIGLAVAFAGLIAGGAVAWTIQRENRRELQRLSNLELDRSRFLIEQAQARKLAKRDAARREAFSRATLAPTLSSQVAAYTDLLQRFEEAWEGRVARARLWRELCHKRRALGRDLPGARQAAEEALRDVEAAIEEAADDLPLELFRAELLRCELRRPAAARRQYRQIAERPLGADSAASPEWIVAYAYGRLALARGDAREAERFARKSLRGAERLPEAHVLLAEALLALERPDEALETLDRLGAPSSEGLLLRGEALRQLGNLRDAESDALRARELDPRADGVAALLGRVYLDQDRSGRALRFLDEALERVPQDPRLALAAARARLRSKQRLLEVAPLVRRAEGGLSAQDPELAEVRQEAGRVLAGLAGLTPEDRALLGLPARPPEPTPTPKAP